ncbi:helix-turn-helix domain-containing protein, partial [Streptomyces sp. S6]
RDRPRVRGGRHAGAGVGDGDGEPRRVYPRDLRGTLRAWIAAQGNAERAADALGIHPQTVRDHVRSAEPVLERQLLTPGADLYEVVLAHLATGDITTPMNGGEPGSPVHR